jgi:ABC-type sugar transport system ATPase subunit
VERLKRNGITFIFISHKMDEIYTVADEMTVLRDGMTIDCKPVNEMPMQELISKMVGREISTFFPPRDSQCGEKLLEVRGLTKAGKFQDISFSVHRGALPDWSARDAPRSWKRCLAIIRPTAAISG